jgi:hypothetical protein
METSAKFLVLRVLQESQFYRMPVPTIEHLPFNMPNASHMGMPVPEHFSPVNEWPDPSSWFISLVSFMEWWGSTVF